MQYLRIKNFDQYQHYKDRNPPWIKLYRCIMNDYDLRSVPIASRLAYIFLLIIASETDNRIPNDHKFLSDRFGFDVNELTLTPLIDSGFLLASGARRVLARHAPSSSLLCLDSNSLNSPDSDLHLKSKKHSIHHGSIIQEEFEQFWIAYPNKTGKKAAFKAFEAAKDKPDIKTLLEAIVRSSKTDKWTKDHGKYIPNPTTWLNQGRWADQPISNGHSKPKPPPFPPKTDPIARGQWRTAYGDPAQYGYE